MATTTGSKALASDYNTVVTALNSLVTTVSYGTSARSVSAGDKIAVADPTLSSILSNAAARVVTGVTRTCADNRTNNSRVGTGNTNYWWGTRCDTYRD